jgi:coenzyme F420-0:L-glutamate ligase/coenzyme F420-1:gamma-L-glutamate ligase
MGAPIVIQALDGVPEIAAGDDLAAILAATLADRDVAADDVLVVAHKVVSKAEGRTVALVDVTPGERARTLGAELHKDPALVQVILDETAEVVRAERGVLIARTHHGFVCANAGVDASNVPGDGTLVLLPRDPDASARALRAGLLAALGVAPAVCVTDSFGRAWRHGQVDVAIGVAGLRPLEDWRGRPDRVGRPMEATWIAVADQLAAAADLARVKDAGTPAALVRGLGTYVTAEDGPGVAPLLRARDEDLFA